MGRSRLPFVYFRPFLITMSIIQIEKSVDCVLEIRTCSRRMVGADETMGAMVAALHCCILYQNIFPRLLLIDL